MTPLPLAGLRSATVVAPHPDDETIGAFGLIRALRRRGAAVRVVVVTDGAASHRASRRWPPHRLAAARRAETLRAMRLAGVPVPAVRFLGFPDSGLAGLGPSQRRRLARAIGRGRAPDLLLLPSQYDNHADHQVVSRAAARAWPAARRLSYLVWPRGGERRPAPRHRIRLGHDRAAKRAALRCYRSQTGLIDDDPEGFVMSPALIAAFSRPLELFGAAP